METKHEHTVEHRYQVNGVTGHLSVYTFCRVCRVVSDNAFIKIDPVELGLKRGLAEKNILQKKCSGPGDKPLKPKR